MNKKTRNIAALIINALIIIFEIIAFAIAIPALGWSNLLYYTEWSNFVLMIAAIIFSVYLARASKDAKVKIPGWLHSLKLCATLSVTITFVVVVTVLSWASKYGLWTLLTYSSMLFFHTLCPLLALASFLFFEEHKLKESKTILKSLAFTIIYAAIILPLNILKIVEGPYPFLKVYQQPVWASFLWIIVIIGGAAALAKALVAIKKRLNSSKSSQK